MDDLQTLERRAMQPCDKGPILEDIKGQLTTLTELMIAVAEHKIDMKYVNMRLDDHEGRIKKMEEQPVKKLMVIYTACVAVIGSLFMWMTKQ